jgi:hypothetical protein
VNAVAVLVALLAAGCAPDGYRCETNADCEAGVCTGARRCATVDEACDAGYRYSASAGTSGCVTFDDLAKAAWPLRDDAAELHGGAPIELEQRSSGGDDKIELVVANGASTRQDQCPTWPGKGCRFFSVRHFDGADAEPRGSFPETGTVAFQVEVNLPPPETPTRTQQLFDFQQTTRAQVYFLVAAPAGTDQWFFQGGASFGSLFRAGGPDRPEVDPAGLHTIAVSWEPAEITITVDGREYAVFPPPAGFVAPTQQLFRFLFFADGTLHNVRLYDHVLSRRARERMTE